MPDDPTLTEDRRKQLDGIVSQMEANQESPDNIQFVVDDFKKKYATAAAQEMPTTAPSGVVGRFVSTAGEEINPVTAVKGIFSAIKDPKAAAQALIDAHTAVAGKAVEEYKKGNYADAAVHLFNAGIPLLGPKIDELAERGAAGDYAGMFGGAVGTGLSFGAPAAISKVLPKRIPGLGVASAQDVAAMARAGRLGLSVDAATATQNPLVGAAQFTADQSLMGTRIAARAQEATANAAKGAIAKKAGQLAPAAQTEETAGAALRTTLENEIQKHHAAADAGYTKLRAIEAQNPIPVDLGPTKQALQPIYDEMQRRLPQTLKDSSPGWTALREFMEGPTFRRLSDVDADLSVVKGLAREGDPYLRSNGQRLASILSKSADADIQTAVTKAGPDAVQALQEGRAATRAKYATADVLGAFEKEPVKAFRQATLKDDAGIERLRSVQRTAPDALPTIGRGYLDDLVSTASAEGGFSGNKAWTAWENLGPETKKLLYPDATMRGDLDAIFRTMKRFAYDPNPSKSAKFLHQISQVGQLGEMVLHPISGVPLQLTAPLVAKLMRSPTGIRLLRDGLTLPTGHPLAQRAAQAIAAMQPAGRTLAPALTPALAQDESQTTP